MWTFQYTLLLVMLEVAGLRYSGPSALKFYCMWMAIRVFLPMLFSQRYRIRF
jgi:hypothetical protein